MMRGTYRAVQSGDGRAGLKEAGLAAIRFARQTTSLVLFRPQGGMGAGSELIKICAVYHMECS